jgi:hypothetical protein
MASKIDRASLAAAGWVPDGKGGFVKQAKTPPMPISAPAIELPAPPMDAEDRLNKTERAWLAVLQSRNCPIWTQEITIKLGHDCRYTPDFVTLEGGRLIAYEVKGFFRDDAAVKIRAAARKFPFLDFYLVRKKGKSWDLQPVHR